MKTSQLLCEYGECVKVHNKLPLDAFTNFVRIFMIKILHQSQSTQSGLVIIDIYYPPSTLVLHVLTLQVTLL